MLALCLKVVVPFTSWRDKLMNTWMIILDQLGERQWQGAYMILWLRPCAV
jgi:hypothetical protein